MCIFCRLPLTFFLSLFRARSLSLALFLSLRLVYAYACNCAFVDDLMTRGIHRHVRTVGATVEALQPSLARLRLRHRDAVKAKVLQGITFIDMIAGSVYGPIGACLLFFSFYFFFYLFLSFFYIFRVFLLLLTFPLPSARACAFFFLSLTFSSSSLE